MTKKFFQGYGTAWSEPLAVGRWARFKQKMREPATKDTWIVGLGIMTMAIISMFTVVFTWFD